MANTCHNHPGEHGPNDCPGVGRIVCEICRKPTVDHRVGHPCPEATERITLPALSRRSSYRKAAEGRNGT